MILAPWPWKVTLPPTDQPPTLAWQRRKKSDQSDPEPKPCLLPFPRFAFGASKGVWCVPNAIPDLLVRGLLIGVPPKLKCSWSSLTRICSTERSHTSPS